MVFTHSLQKHSTITSAGYNYHHCTLPWLYIIPNINFQSFSDYNNIPIPFSYGWNNQIQNEIVVIRPISLNNLQHVQIWLQVSVAPLMLNCFKSTRFVNLHAKACDNAKHATHMHTSPTTPSQDNLLSQWR